MPINVVYIDDEEALCSIFKEYLHSNEINITVFTDEKPAIEYCNNTKPDIVFIDYRLQKQTGDDVAKALSCKTKKILVTGELDVTLNTCFDDIITKPYKLADIKTYIIDKCTN
jgi:DNA-binding response OmpR family regulator